ncbi:hypothetical protein Rpal_3334 [Rhodopseudomonas palustris TIE-1]|uniref:hypothetical protein n=1 Tax=Rhodopseudomonas palustris TaxID=1076 RepID=UPI000164A868|nr:hypothetical protein [Rhodopseudomonas palustris]ACF01836.1 hypothetical protein Rpal_3334 [Rhodopseudomonas palustris TIE-1]
MSDESEFLAAIEHNIQGLSAAAAGAVLRNEREQLNLQRVALVEKAAEISLELAAAESAEKPSVKTVSRLRREREQLNAERQAVQSNAATISKLLIAVEGGPGRIEAAGTTYTIEPS